MQVSDFTVLALAITRLIDAGHLGEVTVEEMHDSILRLAVFTELRDRYGAELDLSLYDNANLQRIQAMWYSIATTGEWRTFGIERDGLCLLVAYCLESAQRVGRPRPPRP